MVTCNKLLDAYCISLKWRESSKASFITQNIHFNYTIKEEKERKSSIGPLTRPDPSKGNPTPHKATMRKRIEEDKHQTTKITTKKLEFFLPQK